MSSVTEQRSTTGPTAGNFTVDLLDRVPRSVTKTLQDNPRSYILITPVQLAEASPAAATVQAQAIYAGQIAKLDDNLRTIDGAGLAVLLGDENGIGDAFLAADSAGSSATFASHYTSNISGRANGLTDGTIATGTAFILPKQAGDTRRDWLDFMCAHVPGTDFEWDVTPAGVINAGLPSSVFTSGAVILADEGGRDGNITGVRADVRLGELDFTELTAKAIVDYDGTTANFKTATNTITRMAGWTGAAYVADRYLTNRTRKPRPTRGGWDRIIAWLIAAATNAQKFATSQAAKYASVRQQLDVTIYEYAPRRLGIRPGNTVYVWKPELGLTNTSNQVQYRGEVTFPIASRIYKMTWPIAEGMGVYHFHSDGAAGMQVDDITRYVKFNTNPAVDLEVGALRRNLATA